MLTIVKITIEAGKGAKKFYYLYALKYAEDIWFVTNNPFHFGKTEMVLGKVEEIPIKYLGEKIKGKVLDFEMFQISNDLIRLEFGIQNISEGRYRAIPFWGFKVYPPMSPEEFEQTNFIKINEG